MTTGDEKFDACEELILAVDAARIVFAEEEEEEEARIVVSMKDITVRKRAEIALRESKEELERRVVERTRELVEARDAAEAANHAKSEFLASMSHELRTPLSAVIGFSEALEEPYFGDLNEKQTQYVQNIQESGRHLLALINDVLDLSHGEEDGLDMHLDPVGIGELLKGSLSMVKGKCLKRHIALNLNVAKDLTDRTITADARKLKQIMYNLLSNSVKFTPEGGSITVEATLSEECVGEGVSVDLERGAAHSDTPTPTHPQTPTLCISVSDTGAGVAPELVEKVFGPFYQIKGGLQGKTPGTGLGLSLCRQLVELHGGTIWMTSEGQDRGCRVTVRLPAEPGERVVSTTEGTVSREER